MAIKLSKRLKAIYNLVEKTDLIADIGTDHAYLAVALIEGKKADKVIASDVHKGPLESACAYIRSCHYEDYIECRLGNGLEPYAPHEVETILICGMGGYLMKEILKKSTYLPQKLVLQPQNGKKELRQYLHKKGYKMVAEELVEDMGHYYDLWSLVHTSYRSFSCTIPYVDPYAILDENHILWTYGALLYEKGHPLWLARLEKELIVEKNVLATLKEKAPHSIKYKGVYKLVTAMENIYEDYCKKHNRML